MPWVVATSETRAASDAALAVQRIRARLCTRPTSIKLLLTIGKPSAERMTYSSAPTPVANALRRSTRSSAPRSSTGSIRRPISATCSSESRTIRSTASAGFCPGTSPHIFTHPDSPPDPLVKAATGPRLHFQGESLHTSHALRQESPVDDTSRGAPGLRRPRDRVRSASRYTSRSRTCVRSMQ
jgi:hypothetical protein